MNADDRGKQIKEAFEQLGRELRDVADFEICPYLIKQTERVMITVTNVLTDLEKTNADLRKTINSLKEVAKYKDERIEILEEELAQKNQMIRLLKARLKKYE